MIPISEYIVQNDYLKAENLIMSNGFAKPQNEIQAVNAINYLLQKNSQENNENFLSELADAHPDYELIEARVLEKIKANKPTEKKSNVAGLAEQVINANARQKEIEKKIQIADEQISNANGDKINKDDKYIKMLTIGSITILAGILLWKL
jgi:tRNA nucleotidyltransferase/poly(A) polymerase